jgi:hypothetical protein
MYKTIYGMILSKYYVKFKLNIFFLNILLKISKHESFILCIACDMIRYIKQSYIKGY